jgi:hypothetical protein
VLQHVREDHAVTRMIEHRGRCCQLPKHQLLRKRSNWEEVVKYRSTIHGRPHCAWVAESSGSFP